MMSGAPAGRRPPFADEFLAALEPLKPAFNLDGDGPLFMQERGLLGDANPIEALLIDTPGANGQKKNADLLTHRDRYGALGLPAAAMALYAMQAYSPAGGAGIRTSMRGGGPLTALVIPASPDSSPAAPIWRSIWANVMDHERSKSAIEKVFPWLRPALVSVKDEAPVAETDPSFDSLHAFFGMPRRIALVFEDDGVCAMTGMPGKVATGFLQRPQGINYGPWSHPLTPYRQEKETTEPYSVKPKSGRFGYRDWVVAVVGENDFARVPPGVQASRSGRRNAFKSDGGMDARIRVGGWAMNNMEAMSYLVAEQPLHLTSAQDTGQLDQIARHMAKAGDLANRMLRNAVNDAVFEGRGDGEKGVLNRLRIDFYERTDDDFHEVLDDGLAGPEIDGQAMARAWLSRLRRSAIGLFDEVAPVPVDDAEKAGRTVKARGFLLAGLAGFSKSGAALFTALELPLPPARTTAKDKEET